MSPYLFILCLDVISQNIQNDDSIKGIKVKDTEIKLIQYADDTTAIVKDERSMHAFMQHINRYKQITGLRVNHSKSKAIWLGNRTPPFKPANSIKWTASPVKVLGIYISWNINEANKITLNNKIQTVKKIIFSWQHRKLTLNGKVTIIKSLLMSQFIHVFNTIPITDEFKKTIEDLVYTFLWNSKTNKVKKSVMIQDFCEGGHRMVDVYSVITTQKLKWVKLYLNNHKCLWRNLMEGLINVENLNILLRSSFHLNRTLTSSQFYFDILCDLNKLNKVEAKNNSENLIDQYAFYNENILIDGKMFYDNEFLAAGLWHISDLYDSTGGIVPFNVWKNRGVCKSKFLIWRKIISKARSLPLTFNNLGAEPEHTKTIAMGNGNILDLENHTSKIIYNSLVKLQIEKPTSLAKYSMFFSILTDSEIKRVFLLPRKCTKDNELREFQFKILHRYLPTNSLLLNMQKVSSNKCTFCELYKETLTHIFFDCLCVRNIWFRVDRVLALLTGNTISLTTFDVMFGFNISSNKVIDRDINSFIMHIKFFIWKQKCKLIIPTHEDLKIYIAKKKNIETNLEKVYEHM